VATQVVGKESRETTSYVSLGSCTKEGHGESHGPLSMPRTAQGIAQVANTPSINAPTEALNQGSCWRRMGETHQCLLTSINTGFMTS
jgi:hypothetical protein